MTARLTAVTGRAPAGSPVQLQVALSYDQRTRSRLRVVLDGEEEIGLMLERGTILRGGDLLQAQDGRVIEIVAAPEHLSCIESSDPLALARASYHLGNRHVLVQLGRSLDGAGWLRYARDHVLDEMLRGQGFAVEFVADGFEPESGAYAAAHAHPGVHANILARSQTHD